MRTKGEGSNIFLMNTFLQRNGLCLSTHRKSSLDQLTVQLRVTISYNISNDNSRNLY